MTSVRVDSNGTATKQLAELNHHVGDEQKEVRDGVAGDGQELLEEDESRINEDIEDVNSGGVKLVQAQAILPRQQPQPQVPVVRWERFLPVRSLKVLLVENDDSTRHVVSALLRNCSYEVTAVSNGLEAWKILEDLTNRIDLVLSEVDMPCLTGIGLLSKIMSHKTCKNVPVIMMSSDDSMGVVFNCLSKGAVDFLVKPIRKNELKNLWQHVWRKCHSSSGSGSESGIHTKRSTKSGSVDGSDNNTGSNYEDEDGSIGLNVRDGSDNGSGTQSSWSKRAVEVESAEPMSPQVQITDPADSTCAQVIHSRPKAFRSNWVPMNFTKESHKEDAEFDDVEMGKDLGIGVHKNTELQPEDHSKKLLKSIAGTLGSKKDGENLQKGKLRIISQATNSELRDGTADIIMGATTSIMNQLESKATEVPTSLSKINKMEEPIYDTKEMPSLELTLNRQRDVGATETRAVERNVLRRSDLSAFSRYNNNSTTNQNPTAIVGSCSPLGNSSEAAKTESMHNLQSNSNATPKQRSNGSSNNNDMGSTTNAFTKRDACTDNPVPKSTVIIHSTSAFQPLQNGHSSSHQTIVQGKADATTVNTATVQSRAVNQPVQVQHHHHHYHHHHHHVHNMQHQQPLPSHEDLTLRKNAPYCGQSNEQSTLVEGNAANYGSSSNNGSNGQNGSSGQDGGSTAVIEGLNMASDIGVGGASGSGSGSGVAQNRSTQREAALNKFRQKRKERCFEKKVRYQSRKKLAEQRPRVRGQFVRQEVVENQNKDVDS